MGKILADTSGSGDHEQFLHGLQQMYSGTRNWGSVRLTVKRSKWPLQLTVAEYIEKHAYALKFKQERRAERRAQLANAKAEPFGLVVKAQSPRRKITAHVS